MSDLQPIFDLANFYLKFRLRSRREMRDYLYKKSKTRYFSHETVDRALDELERLGLINDQEFARQFITSRNKNRPKSEYILRRELNKYGIAKEIIDNYFSENQPDEEGLAHIALQRRWPRFSATNKKERFQKATAFLSRRGFSYDIIKKTIDKLTEKE